jgi:hypothetical protein
MIEKSETFKDYVINLEESNDLAGEEDKGSRGGGQKKS